MKKILGFILLGLLFGCDRNDSTSTLIFTGQVTNKDFDSPIPAKDIKVKIRYYGAGLNLLKMDSALTDDYGNYDFRILDDEAFKQYSVQINDEYYFQCNGISPAVTDFVFPWDIDKVNPNTNDFNVCVTGKIKLLVTKQDVTTKDVLLVGSTINRGSFILVSVPRPISSEQWTEYWFTKNLSVVEYNFILKKENGEIIKWSTEKELQAQKTSELIVSY